MELKVQNSEANRIDKYIADNTDLTRKKTISKININRK